MSSQMMDSAEWDDFRSQLREHQEMMDFAEWGDFRRRLQRFVVALALDSPFVSPRESLLSLFFEKKI